MQIITPPHESTLKILSKFLTPSPCTRLLHYVIQEPVEDDTLLYNLLTRELVLLSEEESRDLFSLDYLRKHWFTVPEGTKEREYADLVRWVLQNKQKKSKNITGYTIFSTMDCNARCFYCFEKGRAKPVMTAETAEKTVRFIRDHCGGEKVKLSWFGGEPLFNPGVIDIICQGLREKNIDFSSTMISNGYLFDQNTVTKAATDWNLKRVQITLDGTEKIYNRVKAYIYREGNPYRIVLENIGHLLDAGVSVSIRLNLDLYNAEDLLDLAQEIAEIFAGRNGLSVYAHHLFEGNRPMAQQHTGEEWDKRDATMTRLNETLEKHGLLSTRGISKKPKLNHCMADSGTAVTILPDGHIGLCEHHSDSEFIGHLDSETFDQTMIQSWKETTPPIPECETCFYYPACIRLKKCANGSMCFEQERRNKLRAAKREIVMEYRRWRNAEVEDADEAAEQC